MKMSVKKRIGKSVVEFTVEGTNLFECQMEAEKLSFYSVFKCGLCENDNLHLRAYKTTEGYEYVKIVCSKCRGSVTFGQQRKAPDVFFLRKNENKELDWKQGVPATADFSKEAKEFAGEVSNEFGGNI